MLCTELVLGMSTNYRWRHLLIDDMLNLWYLFIYILISLFAEHVCLNSLKFWFIDESVLHFKQFFFFFSCGFLCLFSKVSLYFVYFDPN